jgi:hypothetical protein
MELSYRKNNDSLPDLMELQTDTVVVINRETAQRKNRESRPRKPVKVRPRAEAPSNDTTAVEKAPPPVPLQLNVSPSGTMNPYDIITVTFSEPVRDVQKEHFIFETAVDTLWEEAGFDFVKDSLNVMTYCIKRPFRYNEQYRLSIDSAVFCSVYGHCNNPLSVTMTVRSEKDYGHLNVAIKGLPEVSNDSATFVMPTFMELLNSNGSPVRRARVNDGIASFRDMAAEKYYARIVLDANGNDRWDGGSYGEKRQPERVVYFINPSSEDRFEIRENWKFDETWDISNAKTDGKPYELVKNKPKEDTRKKNRDYKSESNPAGRNNSGTSVRGLF